MASDARLLRERQRGIGGSDAGVIAGRSTWKLPLQLFYEKRNELPETVNTVDDDDDLPLWGKLLEHAIARRVAEVIARKIRKGRFRVHPTHRRLIGHPDYVVIDDPRGPGILEIKTAFFTLLKSWQRDGIPDQYYLQIQHYLMVTGYRWAMIAVLFGGSKLMFFEIERDDAVIAALQAMELEFWDRVETNRPPPPTFNAMGNALASVLYPVSQPAREVVWTDVESAGKCRRLLALKESQRRRAIEIEKLEAWIKFKMQDAERAFVPGVGRITWKSGATVRIDRRRLQRAYPAAWADVVRAEASRRFRITTIAEIEDEAEMLAAEGADNATAMVPRKRAIALDE